MRVFAYVDRILRENAPAEEDGEDAARENIDSSGAPT